MSRIERENNVEVLSFAEMWTMFEEAISEERPIAFAKVFFDVEGVMKFDRPGEWLTYSISKNIFDENEKPVIQFRRYSPNIPEHKTNRIVPFMEFGAHAGDFLGQWIVYEPAK